MKFSWHALSLTLCGSLLFGCGDSGSSTVSETQPTSTAAPADSTDSAAPDKDLDPILIGLLDEYEDLPQDFGEFKTAYETNPTDPEAIRNYVGTIEDLGMMHAQRGNQETADAAFIRASQTLTKALDAKIDLQSGNLPAIVYYNHACVLGKQNKTTESLAVLNKAVENGFSNLNQITADKDLAAVRALPEYEGQVTAWKAHFEEMKKKHKEMLVKHANEQLAKGESFPFDFDLMDVDGKPLRLSDLKGQVCIVDIWGTWCPPCRQEIPGFVKLQDKYKKYGFKMIGLNQERGPSPEANLKTVRDFIANNSMNYPCAMISDEVLSQLPEFQGFPTTLFIDHHGKVRMKSVGFHEYEYMAAVVESLLRERTIEGRANTN